MDGRQLLLHDEKILWSHTNESSVLRLSNKIYGFVVGLVVISLIVSIWDLGQPQDFVNILLLLIDLVLCVLTLVRIQLFVVIIIVV